MDALALACGNTRVDGPAGRLADAVPVGEVPDRSEIDPVLDRLDGRRLVVQGTDAALAAVVLRLLRTSRLADVPVGYVPVDPESEVAAVWGLPTDPARAPTVALDGDAERAPLIRDDNGGVLVGQGVLGPVRGVIYCDDELVLRGQAGTVEVSPDPMASADTSKDGLTVRVTRKGLLGKRVTNAAGRAVQVGCIPLIVERDGTPFARPVDKWTWYRHTEDWRLVRGLL